MTRESLTRLDDPALWHEGKAMLTKLFASRTQRDWCDLLEHTDACITPVLTHEQAPSHKHNAARGSFVMNDGVTQPGVAPRFSRTPGAISAPPPETGAGGEATAQAWGIPVTRLEELRAANVAGLAHS